MMKEKKDKRIFTDEDPSFLKDRTWVWKCTENKSNKTHPTTYVILHCIKIKWLNVMHRLLTNRENARLHACVCRWEVSGLNCWRLVGENEGILTEL